MNSNLIISMYSSKYQETDNDFDYFKFITWSPYERIEVKTVTSFKELCRGNNLSEDDKTKKPIWTGVKQCFHLIGIDSNDKDFTIVDKNEGDCVFNIENNHYDFYCVLSMRFDPEIHKIYKDGGHLEDVELIDKIIGDTIKIVDENIPDEAVFKSFRSLGSEDMVMVILANSIQEMINVVNIIRNIKFKCKITSDKPTDDTIDLFSMVYMFTGLNNPNCEKQIDTDLIVNLHLKKHNVNEITEKLEELLGEDVKFTSLFRGKGTLQVEISKNKNTNVLFDKDGILNENNLFYKSNFYGSRVYFKENIEKNNVNESEIKSIDVGDEWHIVDDCPSNNEEEKDEMTDVARFILGEYKRLKADNRFCQWKNILDKHYHGTAKFVKEYRHYDKLRECKLLEQMQASLHLINQACSPASDIPYHNYYYSGSFSDLLRAYYGIITMLFRIIYGLPHSEGTEQHEIVFAVRLEAIARIQSEMYTLKESNDRIIIFSLPYDSFWNYTNNIKFLVHEVFHYAAPYDRISRNMDILNIIFKILLTNHSCGVVKKHYNNKYDQALRDWNAYMLNAFTEDKQIMENLRIYLESVCRPFLELAAPEWSSVFCLNANLNKIVRIVSDEVQKFIIKEENIKGIKEFAADKNMSIICDLLKNTPVGEPSDEMCSHIIRTISTVNIAVREAFCDIWSIKITQVSIPDYILWLINVMVEMKGIKAVEAALSFKFPNNVMNIKSMPLRIYLLLCYEYFEKNDIKKVFDPAKELRNCIKKCTDESIKRCINVFADYINGISATYGIYRDDFCNMAFRNLNNYFSSKEYLKNADVLMLGDIYNRNLETEINYEALKNLIYYSPEIKIKSCKYKKECFDKSVFKTFPYEVSNNQYMISSLPEYLECLNEIYRLNMKEYRQNTRLWYRGICDIRFSLLPSLFRNCDDKLSLYANQANLIKKAYFVTTSSAELWNQPIQQRMASLQHYGLPTNLLDFSLDQFVAIYFSLYPDNYKDKEKIINGYFRPVVYIFNPIAYSNVIECLKTYYKGESQLFYNLSPVVFDFNQNQEERDKFFVGDMSYQKLVDHTKLYNTDNYVPDPRVNLYPVPMVIEHTNPRIKAQSGVFVAFPLDAQPKINKKGEARYKYIDLLEIQSSYNQIFDKTRVNGPFLYSIEIRKDSISSIRNELKQFNIKSGTYYPELFKLLEDLKN